MTEPLDIKNMPLNEIQEAFDSLMLTNDHPIELRFLGGLKNFINEYLQEGPYENRAEVSLIYHEKEIAQMKLMMNALQKDFDHARKQTEIAQNKLDEYMDKYDWLETKYDELIDKVLLK